MVGLSCFIASLAVGKSPQQQRKTQGDTAMNQQDSQNRQKNVKDIYFAGGCFWGVEEYFSRIPGVREVTVGYANGHLDNPSYQDVCSGETGHAEAIHVRYDVSIVSLKTLAEHFFKIIDPTSVDKQGNDVGNQYRTGIFYVNEDDKVVLQSVMEKVQKNYTMPLAVELLPLANYFLAEEYHQDYLKKNPYGYCHINFASLNDIQLEKHDGKKYEKPSEAELRSMLTPEQYEVTQHAATERPFSGKYWDNKERGIYVDITTGEPLFSSSDKFDSGCGWPSFTKPLEEKSIIENSDTSLGMERTEVKSAIGDAHLGHVFDDGPKDKGGLRYCINSAAIRFIPYDKMEQEGYADMMSQVK